LLGCAGLLALGGVGGVFVTLVRAVGINPVKKGQPDEFFGVAARD
jgi:hypothetical protein